jgi:hypothetical protein
VLSGRDGAGTGVGAAGVEDAVVTTGSGAGFDAAAGASLPGGANSTRPLEDARRATSRWVTRTRWFTRGGAAVALVAVRGEPGVAAAGAGVLGVVATPARWASRGAAGLRWCS